MLEVFVDGDACPVKDEVGKVVKRHGLQVTYVSNSWMRVPDQESAKQVVVEGQCDAADDWIVEHVSKDDIVVTADIPLAYRCIRKGARVLDPAGRIFSEANIGQVLATRDLLRELREAGTVTGGGPPPFQKQDRSRFLHSLDQIIQNIKRAGR